MLPANGASSSSTPNPRGIVVFSGGSAANSLVDVFSEVTTKRRSSLTYIIPISDNGGSSSELIRVFGGPGIGDIRSRLVRLMPETHSHIHALLNHRLAVDSTLALAKWQEIVSGTSPLWPPIPSAQRELIRSVFNHVNLEILKRARPPHSTFNFSNASVGNLFLTGARLFTGSFESAIYLMSVISAVPPSISVLPVLNTNFSYHIAAGLQDGTSIVGQNAISHPSAPSAIPEHSAMPSPAIPPASVPGIQVNGFGALLELSLPAPAATDTSSAIDEDLDPEDAAPPFSLQSLRQSAIAFSKSADADRPLPSPISRIWYINPYGQEIHPTANPKCVQAIRNASAVIYSIGSLYTSIIPSIVLRGIGEVLKTGTKTKILILNGSVDRETGLGLPTPMTAIDFIKALATAGEESRGSFSGSGGVDREKWSAYVTHLIYLEGEGVPKVDKEELARGGVDAVRCWGRKAKDGSMRYDGRGLVGALEAILGTGDRSLTSRRNTLER